MALALLRRRKVALEAARVAATIKALVVLSRNFGQQPAENFRIESNGAERAGRTLTNHRRIIGESSALDQAIQSAVTHVTRGG
jgi:hypothetical protein